jgi:DNA-binding CsgD family transcriptional regulator
MDVQGKLLYVNDTTAVLFSGTTDIDYQGKTIANFHPPEFVEERLALVRRVLKENRPLCIHHIYLGNAISSTIWPFRDRSPPFDRLLVISRPGPITPIEAKIPNSIETVKTAYIGLGPLNVLTRRELEVLVLLGHGLSVPQAAAVLHRSPKTIERHKDSIGRKLSLHGQAELVQLVTSLGLELSDTRLARYEED